MLTHAAFDRRCRHCGARYAECAAPLAKACCEHCNHYPDNLSSLQVSMGPERAELAWLLITLLALFAFAAALAVVSHG